MCVTVVGDAFVDIIAPAVDMMPGDTRHGSIVVRCGGTANVAVQMAKLGEKCRFIGKVGDDAFGKSFSEALKTTGIQDLTFVDENNPTGLCISTTYETGERAMFADRGANDYLKKEELEGHLGDIMNSKILYCSGYSLGGTATSATVLDIVKRCQPKCEIWFNPGAPNVIRRYFRQFVREFVDGIVLNLSESRQLTGRENVEEIIQELRKMVAIAVVTLGSSGCVVSGEGVTYIHLPTQVLEVRNTTGAGDAFAAGLLTGRVRGLNLVECARLANQTAAKFLTEA